MVRILKSWDEHVARMKEGEISQNAIEDKLKRTKSKAAIHSILYRKSSQNPFQ